MSDLILDSTLDDVIYSILFVAGEGVDVSYIAEKLEIKIRKCYNFSKEGGRHGIYTKDSRYSDKLQN